MKESWKMESRRICGHIVIVRDLCVEEHGAAGLASRLIGAFFGDSKTLLQKAPVGIQYTSNLLKQKRLTYVEPVIYPDVAVHRVLRTAADMPGSKLVLATSCKDVQQAFDEYKRKKGVRSRPWLSMVCPFSCDQDSREASRLRGKYPNVFVQYSDWLNFMQGGIQRDAACPGFGCGNAA
jgi:hypothetical protein